MKYPKFTLPNSLSILKKYKKNPTKPGANLPDPTSSNPNQQTLGTAGALNLGNNQNMQNMLNQIHSQSNLPPGNLNISNLPGLGTNPATQTNNSGNSGQANQGNIGSQN